MKQSYRLSSEWKFSYLKCGNNTSDSLKKIPKKKNKIKNIPDQRK